MFEKPKPDGDLLRSHTQEDIAVVTLKASGTILGSMVDPALGPVFAVMSEFLTQLIPRQSGDRVRDYVGQLHDRLTGVEEQFDKRINESVAYISLVERATIAAAQEASAEKRRDIAGLVKTGLSRTDAELEQHEMFLRMLQRINDSQVLILMFHNIPKNFGNPALDRFIAKYPEVFPPDANHGDSEDVFRRATMKDAYVAELVRLGLLRETEAMARSEGPPRVEIARLGEYFLAAIEREGRDNSHG